MGIIKAAGNSIGGVLADQWLEVYYCDSIPQGILAVRGQKRVAENSSNTKGEDNVITDGSTVIVNEGQCAIALDKGEITGVYKTAGEHIYHSENSKSIFHRGGLRSVAKQSFERFSYGGDAPVYQVIMYLDIKEHMNNDLKMSAYFTFNDTQTDALIDVTLNISGVFSFKISDPSVFYKKICGNASHTMKVADVIHIMTEELKSSVLTVLGQYCREGVSAYDIISDIDGITAALKDALDEKWSATRGFEIVSIAFDSIVFDSKDKGLIQDVERAKALRDPVMAASRQVDAYTKAMEYAARNKNN